MTQSRSSPFAPYNPRVRPFSSWSLRSLYRWHPTAKIDVGCIHQINPIDGTIHYVPHYLVNLFYSPVNHICASLTLTVPPKHRRREMLVALVNRSGYLAFRFLKVYSLPSAEYVLCSAFAIDGDQMWVDGMLLQSVFDSACVQETSHDTGEFASRIAYGLERHRQRSFVHWQKQQKQTKFELGPHLKGRYFAHGTPTEIEEQLRDLRQRRLPPDELAQEQDRLRKALLEAEDMENRIETRVWGPPRYEETDLFTIEWHLRQSGQSNLVGRRRKRR